MSAGRRNLSLFEYLELGLITFHTTLVTIWATFTFPVRESRGSQSFSDYISYTIAKSQNARASANILQKLNPPTVEVYRTLARTKGFEPAITTLPHGAKALWIGSDKTDLVLVFFHGGGYVKPATTQLDLLWDLKKTLGTPLSICLLSYSLAPGAQYPIQLQQAVGLLKHLIVDAGKKPENIILSGDSAGGNLILGILSHVLHPHPSIEPLSLYTPLRGIALVSPWGSFDTSAASYTSNKYKDSVNGPVLRRWSAYFMGNAKTDAYNQPFHTPETWWQNLSKITENVLITAGADEVLRDDIVSFAQKMKAIFPSVTIVIGAGEVHDQPFMEPVIDEKNRSEQAQALKLWLKKLVRAVCGLYMDINH